MWGILSLTFFQWILSNSLKASVLVVIILLIKLLFKDKISAKIQYLLWLVVVIRLILPWTPESPYSIYNLFQDENNKLPKISYTVPIDKPVTPQSNEVAQDETKETTIPVIPASNFADNRNRIAAEPASKSSTSEPWTMEKSIIVAWLTGVFVLMIISFVRNRTFARQLDAKLITEEEMLLTFKASKDKLRVRADIPLVQTAKVTSPSLYGVFRPMLLLPEQVQAKLSSKQLEYVFVHELVHFKQKDIFVNWVIHLLVILHWFNPLIWYVSYRMREDQELACDAYSLSYIGTEEAKDYGHTLIAMLEGYSKTKGFASLASISGSKSQIKRRLRMLGKVSVKWSLLTLIVVFIISFTALTNAKTDATGTAPVKGGSPETASNKIVSVNSIQPLKLNPQLVESARKSHQFEFTFTTTDDMVNIAYGAFLGGWDNTPGFDKLTTIQKQAAELVPAKPILVHSYDSPYVDYYLIPFIKGQEVVGPMVLEVMRTVGKQGMVRVVEGLVYNGDKNEFTSRRQLFNVDCQDAINILKQSTRLDQVPVPRLVQKSGLLPKGGFLQFNPQQEPLWEFNLPENKHLYVNQQGKVLESDIIPWYEKYVCPNYNPKSVQIEPNKLSRDDGWSLKVTSIKSDVHFPYDSNSRNATVSLDIENISGLDQLFMPKGSIVSITGASGKVYSIASVGLEETYVETQQFRIQQKNSSMKPGLFKYAMTINVDAAETGFTELSYSDEKGNKFAIPINITAQIEQSPKQNGVMEPYKIPGKDWALALTQLEFRKGVNSKTILAALALTFSSNNGADRAFSPEGKVLGLVGTSGKFYAYDSPFTIEQEYAKSLDYKQQRAKETGTGTGYQPGVMALAPEILIGAGEKNFTKIIYQDKTGKKYEIPIQGIKPLSRNKN
jgi:beta-lactamase regulating signal transducer with metallopeptidase domain